MILTIRVILLLVAFVLFSMAALGVVSRVNLTAAGLCFLALAELFGSYRLP